MATMAEYGCALNVEAAHEIMPAAGLRMDQAYLIAEALVAAGDANYAENGGLLQISSARCAQSDGPAAVPAPQPVEEIVEAAPTQVVAPPADPADMRTALLAMLAANNCEVTQANVGTMIGDAGLEFGPAIQELNQLMSEGLATSPDGGQTLQVAPPDCVAASAAVSAGASTPKEIFINLIKQNNCSITASEFNALLPVDGLDASAAFGLIGELEAEGIITLPPTRDTVTLSAENCR